MQTYYVLTPFSLKIGVDSPGRGGHGERGVGLQQRSPALLRLHHPRHLRLLRPRLQGYRRHLSGKCHYCRAQFTQPKNSVSLVFCGIQDLSALFKVFTPAVWWTTLACIGALIVCHTITSRVFAIESEQKAKSIKDTFTDSSWDVVQVPTSHSYPLPVL